MVCQRMDGADLKQGLKWQYDVSSLGYKYNMTDISAAYGRWQLKKLILGIKEENT